jgi:acetyltransferase-like isoleucine patch superfamily enzyme
MHIGNSVVVDDDCFLDAKGCGVSEFRIHDDVMISHRCIISGKDGWVELLERANIGSGCMLYSAGGLSIGRDTILSANCYIGGGRYEIHGSIDVPISRQLLPGRGVVIEDNCWLGAGVVVVDGVRIGRDSVVGAGAVVTHDVAPRTIVAGVPAKPLGYRSVERVSERAVQEK